LLKNIEFCEILHPFLPESMLFLKQTKTGNINVFAHAIWESIQRIPISQSMFFWHVNILCLITTSLLSIFAQVFHLFFVTLETDHKESRNAAHEHGRLPCLWRLPGSGASCEPVHASTRQQCAAFHAGPKSRQHVAALANKHVPTHPDKHVPSNLADKHVPTHFTDQHVPAGNPRIVPAAAAAVPAG
jgi:hypothetical protein